MDFTIRKYRELLEALVEEGYGFVRFGEYMKIQESRSKIQEKVKNQESSLPAEGLPKAGDKRQETRDKSQEPRDREFHSSIIDHHSSSRC